MAVCKFCGASVSIGSKCEYCGQIAEKWYYPDYSGEKDPPEISHSDNHTIDGCRFYIVKRGDNLWGIAKRFYGRGDLFRVIAKENNIKNPNLIYPGQMIRIPKEVSIDVLHKCR